MSLAGHPVLIEHASGEAEESQFPALISPDSPFVDVRAMTHSVATGTHARLELTGEVFESEDHRNWSDASFKTYCTPIALPFPVTVEPAWQLEQEAVLTFTGLPALNLTPAASARLNDATRIQVSNSLSPLPRVGVQLGDWPVTNAHLDALRQLALDHLRIDLDARDPHTANASLHSAARIAQAIGCQLHASVFDGDSASLLILAASNEELGGPISCWFIFRSDEKVTSSPWIREARILLGDDAMIAGGTNLYFTELNRQPPDTTDLDVVNFSVTPQVHSFDDRTLIQNAATLEVLASNVSRLAPNRQVSISPITLRPRFNPNATDPSTDVSNDDLPASVDYRQSTWFTAAWAAVSLRSLSTPGTINSVTYFEAIGPRGILDSESAEPFPAHQLFRALVGASSVRPTTSQHPEACDALIVEGAGGSRVIIANLTEHERVVTLHGHLNETINAAPQALTVIDLPGGTNVDSDR